MSLLYMPVTPALQKWGQKAQELRSYSAAYQSKAAWATWDPNSKMQNSKNKILIFILPYIYLSLFGIWFEMGSGSGM